MSPTLPVGSSTPTTTGSGSATAPTATVDKNMFLQLLVAQLKNQDPLNPTDSSQFVTQLAQFQQLESSTNMETDVSDIRGVVDQFSAGATTGSTDGTNQTTNS